MIRHEHPDACLAGIDRKLMNAADVKTPAPADTKNGARALRSRVPENHASMIAFHGRNSAEAATMMVARLRGEGVAAVQDSFMRPARESFQALVPDFAAAADTAYLRHDALGCTLGELETRIATALARYGRTLGRLTIRRVISRLVSKDYTAGCEGTLLRTPPETVATLRWMWYEAVRRSAGENIWIDAVDLEWRRHPGTVLVLSGLNYRREAQYVRGPIFRHGEFMLICEKPGKLYTGTRDFIMADGDLKTQVEVANVACRASFEPRFSTLTKDVLRLVFGYLARSEAYILELHFAPEYPELAAVADVKPPYDFMKGITTESSAFWGECVLMAIANPGWHVTLDMLAAGEMRSVWEDVLLYALRYGNIPAADWAARACTSIEGGECRQHYAKSLRKIGSAAPGLSADADLKCQNLVALATFSDNESSLRWALGGRWSEPRTAAAFAFGLAARMGSNVSLKCANSVMVEFKGGYDPEVYADAADAASSHGRSEMAELINAMGKDHEKAVGAPKAKKDADSDSEDLYRVDRARIESAQFDMTLLLDENAITPRDLDVIATRITTSHRNSKTYYLPIEDRARPL